MKIIYHSQSDQPENKLLYKSFYFSKTLMKLLARTLTVTLLLPYDTENLANLVGISTSNMTEVLLFSLVFVFLTSMCEKLFRNIGLRYFTISTAMATCFGLFVYHASFHHDMDHSSPVSGYYCPYNAIRRKYNTDAYMLEEQLYFPKMSVELEKLTELFTQYDFSDVLTYESCTQFIFLESTCTFD